MAKKETTETVEQPDKHFAFDIGQKVKVGKVKGEVLWRRENQAGEQDFLIKTDDGETWHAAAEVAAA